MPSCRNAGEIAPKVHAPAIEMCRQKKMPERFELTAIRESVRGGRMAFCEALVEVASHGRDPIRVLRDLRFEHAQ